MPTYALQDQWGYLGLLEHPAPNLGPGDVVVLPDGRDARVTAAIGAGRYSKLAAVLEVVVESEASAA
jgi:hypothetical protein